jgi:hypothetical protein
MEVHEPQFIIVQRHSVVLAQLNLIASNDYPSFNNAGFERDIAHEHV